MPIYLKKSLLVEVTKRYIKRHSNQLSLQVQCYFLTQLRPVKYVRAPGGTFNKALSVFSSTTPTAVMRFLALTVNKLIASLSCSESVNEGITQGG